MTRIDAHHHVWDLAVRDQPWTKELPLLRRSFSYDELAPALRAHDIDGTVVVQTVCVPQETPELLALAAATPAVAGVVGWTDLEAADVAEQLAAVRGGSGGDRLVGIRHQVQEESDPQWLARPAVRRGLAAVAGAGLVYDLVVRADQLPMVLDAVRAVPQLGFVLDHGGKPPIASGALDPWRSQLRELAGCPNVAVKLSGLATEAQPPSLDPKTLRPYAETLLETFGADRTMFGSDWPVCLLAGSYDEAIGTAVQFTQDLSPDERADVFGGTAVRTYRLGVA
ncbi:amidohydrolase family protein [Flexivirga oryzae]|uniref:L-fuconolactonase n=1 Tax=Flexivirga oryzae TaxID=1794944 RepID=A0A839NE76_9MICO|nr:L-fuconolactonase [Flexivirga oryzae]